MRKLYLAAAALSVLLSGCLKSDDTASKLKPVAAGLNIFNIVQRQQDVALQPADAAIRLAMLLAEAKKTGQTDLEQVKVGESRLATILFGAATRIEETADGYAITYSSSNGTGFDTYCRIGTVSVRTNGAEQLADTDASTRWVVTVGDKLMLSKYASMAEPITVTGGTTSLYYYGNGVYRIEVASLAAHAGSEMYKSNWNISYEWKPADMQLTYSGCAGKESSYQGDGGGESFVISTLTNAPMHMWYRITAGKAVALASGGYMTVGTIECGFSDESEYSRKDYPAPSVRIERGETGSSTVSYNGHTVTL